VLPIAFDARDATKKISVNDVAWKPIADYGRVESAMSIFPVTASSILPPDLAPQLVYSVWFPQTGTIDVTLITGPVMDFVPDRGMRIAVSFDDEVPQVLDILRLSVYQLVFLSKIPVNAAVSEGVDLAKKHAPV